MIEETPEAALHFLPRKADYLLSHSYLPKKVGLKYLDSDYFSAMKVDYFNC